jgi:hypothetical protein
VRFLSRLFGKRKPDRSPWFPQCHVYYNSKRLVISSVQSDVTGWWSIDGDPLALFLLSANLLEIGQAVINSLAGSHDRLTNEEAERQYASMPNRIGEPSWRKFEKQWDMIHIATEKSPEAVDIYPMHRYETGEWTMQTTDSKYHCRLDASEIGQIISKIVHGPPPEIISHEPSHV